MAPPFYPFPLADVPSQLNCRTIEATGVVIGQPPDSVTIVPFPLRHPQGCTGFRVEADHAVVVYASDFERGDPALDATLDQACHGAGLLICDAQYTDEELDTHRGWGHSTWRQATEVARAAQVGRLALFHHDPVRTDAELDRIVDQARALFPATDAAREGDVITT
jgi:ribonuclease BN (tRNA processing enzyme)